MTRTLRALVAALFLFALALLAAGCGGPAAPTPDGIFVADNAYGGPAPADAEVTTSAAFAALVENADFRWEGRAARAVRRAAAAAQLASDRAAFAEWTATAPELTRFVAPPDTDDPAIETLADGNYALTFTNRAGEEQTVVTMGEAANLRDLIGAQELYEDPANQLAVYRAGYARLSAAARADLPAPEALEGATLEALLAANAQLEAALAGEVDALERAALAAVRQRLAQLPGNELGSQGSDGVPAGFPENAGAEERAGSGGDRVNSGCGRTAGGLYLNVDWPLRYFITSTKDQGNRGSCVAFALTSAAETQVAVRDARWVNLSEQYLYNRIKSAWDADAFDDGADTADMAREFAESDYRLPYEDQWNYNPSPFREEGGDADDPEDFVGSCIGYTERCSQTSHQGRFVCTVVDDEVFCGSRPPNPGGEGMRMDAVPAMLWTNVPWSNGLPVSLLRTFLASGQPVVASIQVAAGIRGTRLDDNGFLVDYDDDTSGGHALHLVGYVENSDLAAALPDAPYSPGGYLIAKNSWGTCYGDGGLVYIPLVWASMYFKNITVYLGVQPDDAFTNQPPTIDITAPADGATLPQGTANLNAFSAAVADAEDGAACCDVAWSSDVDGELGSGASVEIGFATPGARVVTAVVTDSLGVTARDSVSVDVTNPAPVAEIAAPTPGEAVPVGIPYTLQGSAGDLGNLGGVPCEQLSWSSNVAGDPSPTGCTPQVVFETAGVRKLTLTAVDDFGASGSASVVFAVVPTPELWSAITEPTPNALFLEGSPVDLAGVISQEFDLPATYSWHAYRSGRSGDPVVIAAGDVVLFATTGSKLVPNVEWNPADDGVGTGTVALELVIDGANGSAASARVPITISKLE